MKRFILAFSMACLVLCLVPCAAMAEGNSVGLKLNYFTPNSDDFDGFDSTMGFEFVYGKKLSRNAAFEVGLLYRAPEYSESGLDSTVTMIGIPFTFKGVLPVANNVDLFAGAGFGLYYSNWETTYDFTYYGYNINLDYDINGYGFGFHLVGGADFKVTPNFALGGELKWEYCGVMFDDDDTGISDTFDLGGITLGVAAKYLF